MASESVYFRGISLSILRDLRYLCFCLLVSLACVAFGFYLLCGFCLVERFCGSVAVWLLGRPLVAGWVGFSRLAFGSSRGFR